MSDDTGSRTPEKAALRADIRKWLDVAEDAVHADVALSLAPSRSAELALLLRRIQDAAARSLGYE